MKAEILNNTRINVITNTVFMFSPDFNFTYTPADDIVKDEYKGKYRYFGGLQCNYEQGSDEYKALENKLCDVAEAILNQTN